MTFLRSNSQDSCTGLSSNPELFPAHHGASYITANSCITNHILLPVAGKCGSLKSFKDWRYNTRPKIIPQHSWHAKHHPGSPYFVLNVFFVRACWLEHNVKEYGYIKDSSLYGPSQYLSFSATECRVSWHRVEIKLCCLQHNASPAALLLRLCSLEMDCMWALVKALSHFLGWVLNFALFTPE